MISKVLWLIHLAAFGQGGTAPVPPDPLELVTGPIRIADTAASRDTAIELLTRARNHYDLRRAGRGYDLKVTFTVDSGGTTEYEGAWEMEDIFDPQQGLHWTARAAGGYATTQIASNDMFYGDGTASTIPLRLHEARAALLGPLPAAANVNRDSIRMSSAIFNGTHVTCVLLSDPGMTASVTAGRHWEETEECIDPESGLLLVHSQVPGRYLAYEYSSATSLGDYGLPGKVTVSEGGRTVSEILVNSLVDLTSADASLFAPTEKMKVRGPSTGMAGARWISGFIGRRPFAPDAAVRPVVVFGLVTSTGQLVEAHSLQPSDPNSKAAVAAAKRINFAHPTSPGSRPRQHFVFIIEKFVSPR